MNSPPPLQGLEPSKILYRMPKTNSRPKSNGQLVRAPMAQNKSSKSQNKSPEVHREMERIQTVAGSVAFASVANIAVNPGLPEFAPWLSGLAAKFDRYILDSLIVRYKNLKGANSDGNVIISFDPDTLDAGPASAVEQTQASVYVDGAPWRIFQMKVPCDQQKRYVRTGPLAGVDLKTYDMGRLWISTEGCANTSAHGYIEIEYSVRLFEKQSGVTIPVNQSVALYNLPANQAVGGSTVVDIDEAVTLPSAAPPTNLNGTVTLPLGNFLVTAQLSWTGATTGTLQIRQDGAAMPIPALFTCSGAGGCALTAYVRSVGGTTIDVYYTHGGTAPTFQADGCRIILNTV